MATVADRILHHLSGVPSGLDDGQLAQALDARRQTVNQACRRLAEQGRLHRAPGPGGVIVNRLFNSHPPAGAVPAEGAVPAVEAPETADAPDAAAPDAAAPDAGESDVTESDVTETAEVTEAVEAVEATASPSPSLGVPHTRPAGDDAPGDDASDAPTVDGALPVTGAVDLTGAGEPAPGVPDRPATESLVTDSVVDERTVIPAARNGEPTPAPTTSIPAARTSEADDAAPLADATPEAGETEIDDTEIEVAPVADATTEAAVPVPATDVADEPAPHESSVPADPAAAGESDEPDSSTGLDEPSAQPGRPWWKRLLPWGNG